MKEFYLVRLFTHENGWRFTVGEIMNFDTGANWWLVAIEWSRWGLPKLAISALGDDRTDTDAAYDEPQGW